MSEVAASRVISIPRGTNVLVGAPSQPVIPEHLQEVQHALAGVEGLKEAYLPLVFAKELSATPQLLLAVVAPDNAFHSDGLATIVAATERTPWSSKLPIILVDDTNLIGTLRKAGVQVFPQLSPEWNQRPRTTPRSNRVLVAVLVSLLVLAAWELLRR